ncbi:MAG: YdcF family protein [Deltaproteobacteria bacterium]|nr:YdcF family protein [Deltaproteobacteria bacterium]
MLTTTKRYSQWGKILIFIGLLTLYLLSIRPVSDALIEPLEYSFPSIQKPSLMSKSLIIVLGGGATDLSWRGINAQPSRTSVARLAYGITLYRQALDSDLVISGGSGDPESPHISEANAMKDAAVSLGISEKNIIVEGNSRNTIESVKALKSLVGERNTILVTSAFHMKRAAAMFKRIGIDVIPAPTDYRSEQKRLTFYSFIPHAGSLENSSTALYEYMALIWYKIRGVI